VSHGSGFEGIAHEVGGREPRINQVISDE